MKLEKELKEYKRQTAGFPKEEKISETIQKSKEVFILREQEQRIGYLEFLISQFHFIRKRWWVLQVILLGVSMAVLPHMGSKTYAARSLSLVGVLFVVLMIPEFWKNKSCDCMQVEAACFYSLRQIYAARMFLFGLVDVSLMTIFCGAVSGGVHMELWEVLVQFLFPATVAACICFGTLCGSAIANEGTAILFCLFWSVLWWEVMMNEAVYRLITFPVWCALFGMALIFLAGAAYKTIQDCNRIWEVNISEITIS